MSHVLALCGGVGGAKLAAGLAAVLPGDALTIAVNTGDDFEHLGLAISPDIDTVVYTLAGLADRVRGWGVAEESWQAMAMLERLGEPGWFRLGDRDLAMHIARTRRLAAGASLSDVTDQLRRAVGIAAAIVPMSDDPVRTEVETAQGVLAFQRYFVAEQCKPVARAIRFAGADSARAAPSFLHVLNRADLAAVLICPSNPYLSIDPILAVPGVRAALSGLRIPRIAVSPIVGGRAIKGPTTKLMAELGIDADVHAIARHYAGLIDGIVIDEEDAAAAPALTATGLAVAVTQTIMRDDADRAALADAALGLAKIPASLRSSAGANPPP
jgi:LPPG:FO 2-phospho-L-lactate transferase